MANTLKTIKCDLEEYVKEGCLDINGTSICEVEQPIQRIVVETEGLRCINCGTETHDKHEFVHHLIDCYENNQSLARFRKYNLYSTRIHQLQTIAESLQTKYLLVPVKGLSTHVLKVPHNFRLGRIFAAGAHLTTSPGGALSMQLPLEFTISSQTCTL